MDLSRVIAISGKPGLYKLISQTRNGFVVEDLEKGKKMNIAANYNVSLLDNVAIYGVSQEHPLAEVFFRIYKKENGGQAINHKESGANLRAYMEEVLPEYDAERVYDSDLKKLFQWYNLLQSKGLLNIDVEAVEKAIAEHKAQVEAAENGETPQVEEAKEEPKEEVKKEEKAEKKPAAKKTTAKKETTTKKASDSKKEDKAEKKPAAKKATKKDKE